MEIQHLDHPPEAHRSRETSVKGELRLDVLASVAAALAAGLSTYLFLRAARAMRESDKAEIEVELELEARRSHRPLAEPVP